MLFPFLPLVLFVQAVCAEGQMQGVEYEIFGEQAIRNVNVHRVGEIVMVELARGYAVGDV